MSYSSGFKKSFSKEPAPKKIIYADDSLYAGEGANGFYLFHTTKDPENKFHMVRIGDLEEKPQKKYIEDVEFTSQGKKKFKLSKEDLKDWVSETYDYVFLEKPSPWAPKKMGVKAEKRARDDSDEDKTDDDQPSPPKKQQSSETPSITQFEVTNMFADIQKQLASHYVLLAEIAQHSRNNTGSSRQEEEQ